ncbi:MAG: hypothetical protein JXA73_08775 [Acidobacteria bacterium]|nr:hypothetical protein [Acidobacteriota bacterium]
MARAVNIYVKKQLRLDLLNVPQRAMYDIGNAALGAIRRRVARAYDADDRPAEPLKSRSWKHIKKHKGLKPVRDLHGTGMMWPENYKGGKRKPRLKFVGHLMDQIAVRRVSDNQAFITEPSTRAGRLKARRHKAMLLFSPSDRAIIMRYAKVILSRITAKLIRAA